MPVRTTIEGTLNSTPNQSFTVQCFVAAQDPSAHGEGKIPAGQDTTVTTDEPRDPPETSEFSDNVLVSSGR